MSQLLVPLFVFTVATLGAGAAFLVILVALAGVEPDQRRAWAAWLRRTFCRIFFDCFGRGGSGVGNS